MTKPPIFSVLSRTLGDAGGVIQSLVELAFAEVRGSLGSVAKGIGALVTGLFVSLVGVLFLLHAAVSFLVTRGIPEYGAYLIVGGGALVLGLLCCGAGALFFRGASPVPHRAIREARAVFNPREL